MVELLTLFVNKEALKKQYKQGKCMKYLKMNQVLAKDTLSVTELLIPLQLEQQLQVNLSLVDNCELFHCQKKDMMRLGIMVTSFTEINKSES